RFFRIVNGDPYVGSRTQVGRHRYKERNLRVLGRHWIQPTLRQVFRTSSRPRSLLSHHLRQKCCVSPVVAAVDYPSRTHASDTLSSLALSPVLFAPAGRSRAEP